MAMPTCERCGDRGFFFDEQCLNDTCAHRGELKAVRDGDGNVDEKAPKVRTRVMPCPSRPCFCAAGTGPRAELKAKCEEQHERFQLITVGPSGR